MLQRPALALAALGPLLLCACRKEEVVEPAPAASVALADAGPPRDRLAPGELLEGTEKAFGLTLPRRVHVDQAFVDVVYASGDPRPEAVANYVRARVRMGTVQIGAASTLFERVQIPGSPGREYSIRVAPGERGDGCRVDLRDVTPPALPPTEVERWRAVGLTPQGKILDPTHLE
jgi:hypothetical protein